ncbi:hypothetical protein IWQ61_000055 [Dispira simplex]|nr:hypothetical protein IWQ61_000055 [Dispira simplex]
MFGCIVAGRLVQTNLQQVDVNKYVFELTDPHAINHLVVFLLGTIPFESGYAATVHFHRAETQTWQLLGMLSNTKPSAIFRLRPGNAKPTSFPIAMMSDSETLSTKNQGTSIAAGPSGSATLGISIEPLASVEAQVAQLYQSTVTPSSTVGALVPHKPTAAVDHLLPAQQQAIMIPLVKKVMENLYNFVTSFIASGQPGPGTNPDNQSIPIKAFETWYRNVEHKLQMSPDFLNQP